MGQNILYNMNKHKTEDYKISAVKHYLKNKIRMEQVCKVLTQKKLNRKINTVFHYMDYNIRQQNPIYLLEDFHYKIIYMYFEFE